MSVPERVVASVVVLLSGAFVASCSGSGGESGQCAFGVRWHGVGYTAIGFHAARQHLSSSDLKYPSSVGRHLGVAKGLGCNGTSGIYAVPGVRSTLAVMTEDGALAIAKEADIPAQLIEPTASLTP